MTNRTGSFALPHVIRTIIDIAAPPERVFEALTDPRELARWWGDRVGDVRECASDPRPGGEWRVETTAPDGTGHAVEGRFLIIDEPRRIDCTWQEADEDDPSVVRYELEPLDIDGTEGTRLTVTHTGPVAVALGGHTEWIATLPALADILRRRALRHVTVYA